MAMKNPPPLKKRTPQEMMRGLSQPTQITPTSMGIDTTAFEQSMNIPKGLVAPKYTYTGPQQMASNAFGVSSEYSPIGGIDQSTYTPMQYTPPEQTWEDLTKVKETNAGLGGVDTGGEGIDWFGDRGAIGSAAAGLGAAANLANAYMGYKNYGLAKDKFAFEKAATNRNIENQAQQYNTELQNRADIGLALGGSNISPEQRANTLAQMERQKISGAALG